MELTVKKREWIKNVAIIFLAVLLILTFFSNTILNRSLPQVATQNVHSGTIAARIRGTGTVSASQNYQVTIQQSRKVRTVMVKQGQEVNVGDVLFVLSEADSTELEAARDSLRQLQTSYQQKLVSAAEKDYAKEDRNIQLAREALAEAEAALAELSDVAERIAAAEAAVTVAEADVTAAEALLAQRRQELDGAKQAVTAAQRSEELAQEQVNQAQADQTRAEEERSSSGALRPDEEALEKLAQTVTDKTKALNDAKNAREATELIYGKTYAWIHQRAVQMIEQSAGYKALPESGDSREQYLEQKLPTYERHVKELIEEGLLFPYNAREEQTTTGSRLVPDAEEIARYTKAYTETVNAQNAVTAAQEALDAAQREYDLTLQKYETYTALQRKVEEAEAAVDAAKQAYRDAQWATRDAENARTRAEEAVTEAQSALQERRGDLDTAKGKLQETEAERDRVKSAEDAVKSARKNLEDQIFALQEQQRTDDRQARLDAIEVQDLSARIATEQRRVNELSADAGSTEILAEVSGVIETLGITAGQTTTPGSPLATIEIPDMGYVLSFSVTNDQARRVRVGDTASVTNMYWGSQIDATLTGIKTDPKDPQNSKQLTFTLTGDVTPGSNLTLSVGQRSAEYDYVVPNSAIRSDSNGDFVLVVEAKNSPLGDRYTAVRAEVTKLANDDTSTAVSGALNAGDYIITTSTAPIKNGDRVRLADSQTGASKDG